MSDQYDIDLAQHYMHKSLKVEPGDNVWIEHQGPDGRSLAEACAEEVRAVGGIPCLVDSGSEAINRDIAGLSAQGVADYGARQLDLMTSMQRYIRIKDNADQAKIDLTEQQRVLYKTAMGPMIDHRINHTRWLVVQAATEALAADCGMTLPEFKKFNRKVSLADHDKMIEPARPLEKLMTATNLIWIISPAQDTYLSMRKDDIPAVACTGETNNPDGEVFTAPLKYSVNGTYKSGPTKYDGESFEFIRLAFEDGKIVYADAENEERTKKLNEMLDRDEGARYLGEFAVSFHPDIKTPVGDIGYDEKIDGAIHIAKGSCYNSADNGNKSINHWDVVQIHRPEYGGGEIWFDGKLVRKDGVFVLPELEPLNPDNLRAAMSPSGALAATISGKDGRPGGAVNLSGNDSF